MNFRNLNEKTYDSIATEWDKKRQIPWKPIIRFLENIPNKKNKKLLDLGCGTGRHLELALELGFEKENLIGSDISENQLKLVYEKGFYTLKSDIINHNLESESQDVIICIAVINHLLEKEDQLQSLKEIRRIIKPNGKILISNWNPNTEYIQDQINKGKFEFLDDEMKKVKVTFTFDNNKYDRYYYLFSKEEFEKLCYEANLKIINSFIENGNLYVELTRDL